MRSHGRRALVALSAIVLILTIPATSVGAGQTADYVVVAEPGASSSAVKAAVKAAGGKVTGQNAAIDTYSATGPASGFILAVSASAAVDSAAHARPIGSIPGAKPVKELVPDADAIAAANARGNAQSKKPGGGSTAGLDPLDGDQWGLKMVRSDLAREVNAGDRRVLVGIIDSGIDFSHPDLDGQVDFGLSRNFAPDIPSIDGPCEAASCIDPVGTDDNGHGTHVAGIVAAEANGLGISGVAPGVRLVALKGGQDSGFVFLDPVINALTYAADNGVDVVNMSFYVDPWLYNCQNNPADSPEAQAEQRAIVIALSRALDYAHGKNVTLINALGNNHEDVGHPRTDLSSPDFPGGTSYPRVIDNATCLSLPAEGPHVIGVSSLGPSTAKADYSNYGVEQISVSAPGGWFRDLLGTPDFRTNPNQILSTWSRGAAVANGWVDPTTGEITGAGVAAAMVKSCNASACGLYRYIQGTSMAAPHATGVAALIVSRFGIKDNKLGGLRLAPDKTEFVLLETAAEHACPNPPLRDYGPEGRPDEFDALCEGDLEFNGFYGSGIVDAYAAVTEKLELPD
jgi:subtilisin family serine protease